MGCYWSVELMDAARFAMMDCASRVGRRGLIDVNVGRRRW